jgi:hypothetical protein
MIAARTEPGRDSEVLSSALVISQTSARSSYPTFSSLLRKTRTTRSRTLQIAFTHQQRDTQTSKHLDVPACPDICKILLPPSPQSRGSAVGIATGYGLDGRRAGVRVLVGARIFTSPCRPDWRWGPPSLLSNGYQRFFPRRVKRPGREADHSPPTSAEVKKMCIYTSTPLTSSWRSA